MAKTLNPKDRIKLCMAPLDESDDPEICKQRAVTRRVVEGLACALCAEHAAELDAEGEYPKEDL